MFGIDKATHSLIARFMGSAWGPSGADRTQVGPCWPHEPCFQGYCQQIGKTYRCDGMGWQGTHGFKVVILGEKNIQYSSSAKCCFCHRYVTLPLRSAKYIMNECLSRHMHGTKAFPLDLRDWHKRGKNQFALWSGLLRLASQILFPEPRHTFCRLWN